MQKIDKRVILSNDYKIWLDSLPAEHPKYNSSSNKKYYTDIKMSLLHCQNGLCAYTEEFLCDNKFIVQENWDKNKYIRELTKSDINEIQGDLEHFDESLKTNQGWLWDNFFVVNTYVNCRIKLSKPIKNILKPDDDNYDPNKYLSFSYETGIFSPNINLTKSEQKDVEYMIEILGLNCIHIKRKKQLKDWLVLYELGLPVDNFQFVTAWDMTLSNLNNQ